MPKMQIRERATPSRFSGKDRGKQGTVLRAYPAEGKIKVEGVAVVKKGRPSQPAEPAGRHRLAGAKFDASNAMLVLPSGAPTTRVGHKQASSMVTRPRSASARKCGHALS